MGRNVSIFVAGVITIGIITAATMKGRDTANVVGSLGKAGSGLLGTAINGK